MPMIPAGPYRILTTAEGSFFPYYVIPFDAEGRCEGPVTLQHVLDHCVDHTDIFVCAHGGNIDWSTSTKHYEHFISGFQTQRRVLGLPVPSNHQPLLVGIFWPSQAMTWFESETCASRKIHPAGFAR